MVTIRPATSADVDAVRRIATAAFDVYTDRIGQVPQPALADHEARIGDTWIAEHDGVPVGYAVLVAHPDHLEVDAVAVDPGAQGTGTGRALLDHAETRAGSADLGVLRLCTNVHMRENQAIYAHLGWTETARGAAAGYDRVYYEKRLTR